MRTVACLPVAAQPAPCTHTTKCVAWHGRYSTWGRRDGDPSNPDLYPDFLTMNALTTEGYELYRAVVDDSPRLPAGIAPAGAAFELVHSEDRALFLRLYDPDGSHPSIIGSYLTSCVFVAWLSGAPTEGLPFYPSGMTDTEARYLQTVADRVVLLRDGLGAGGERARASL